MAFLFWCFAKARKPFFFVCYGGLYVISKTERDLSERIEKVILYYLAKYYILLGHFLYITWGSIIIYVCFFKKIIHPYLTIHQSAMHILLHPISSDEGMQQCLLRLGRHREGRHPVTQPLLIAGIYHKLILGIFHLTDIDSSISTIYQHVNLTSSPFCTGSIHKRTARPGINIRQNTRNT